MKLVLTGMVGFCLVIPAFCTARASAAHKPGVSQEPQQPDKEKQKPRPEPQQQPPAPPQEPRPEPKPKERKPEPNEKNQNPDTGKRSKEEHKQQQQRSATQNNAQHPRGQRIPDPKFHSSFGPQHTFRPQRLQDNRRFQYAGYWFEIVEVWPADWAFDDPCYIDTIDDDYYLFDTFHPGVRVLVIVVE